MDPVTEIDLDQLEKQKVQHYMSLALDMFPDVDLAYIEDKCTQFAFDMIAFNEFIQETMISGNYPKTDRARVPEEPYDVNNYWKQFSVETFVRKFPDPVKYFSNSLHGLKFISHSVSYLQERYKYRSATTINSCLKRNNYSLYLSNKALSNSKRTRKTPRPPEDVVKGVGKAPSEFFDEVTFIKFEKDILLYVKEKFLARQAAVQEARQTGTLFVCGCCWNEDLLAEDMIICSNGHNFCRDCLLRSSEILLGEGKIDFPCLQDCGAFFCTEVLKDVLPLGIFATLARKLQEREIAQSGLPPLETCSFCKFSAIPNEASKTFDCPHCRRSSCRLCHRLSHLPYQCNEMDDIETTNRKYVEERMTEALVRLCYACGSKFIREEGCNKMVCHCGAIMCYLCRKPIVDYSHFNNDSDPSTSDKCPLWSASDLHDEEVNQEAERAINDVKRKNPEIDIEIFNKLKN